MCGIIGYVGKPRAKDLILEALQKLEYRGYDSTGIALLENGKLWIEKKAGKVRELAELVNNKESNASTGIGHSRWATHGEPSDINAHPHWDCRKNIAVIHNGIIENYLPYKEKLQAKGHEFLSQTDTEVIAHLIEENYKGHLEEAVRKSLQGLHGAFAIAVIAKDSPGEVVVARQCSPLVLGLGQGENFAASDIPALLNYTRDMVFLNDGEIATIRSDSIKITDWNGKIIERKPQRIEWDVVTAQKQGYKHFMLKEIHEQPDSVANSLRGRYALETGEVRLHELEPLSAKLKKAKMIYLIACGTAYHAGMTAKYLWQEYLDLPISVELASEFRYSHPYLDKDTLVVAISQSGETMDTMAAVRKAREAGTTIVSIVNVVGSTLTRESDGVVYTHAGPEISVASTKATLTQITVLNLLGLYMGQLRGTLSAQKRKEALDNLVKLPKLVEIVLKKEKEVEQLAQTFYNKANFLFLGRDILCPIALEGALKLKEISYIHAEGYAAGEMKHGPIALIDQNMPVIVLVTKNSAYDKVFANVEEVRARKGIVIALTDDRNKEIERVADYVLEIPHTAKLLTPMLFTIPLQLLAYHVGVLRGTDVDQPRNLAKSVTVE
ncbi:glutamine--fructose-6-phosphate transaminase (isomerizing) [Candidatus Acetothermia bacterium]|nr:glutamine--fructose-6-phosphate transaminase (isomerizing) [Candidatus Acetothermia bacterium]